MSKAAGGGACEGSNLFLGVSSNCLVIYTKLWSGPFFTSHTGVGGRIESLADMITDLNDWELNLLANIVKERNTII